MLIQRLPAYHSPEFLCGDWRLESRESPFVVVVVRVDHSMSLLIDLGDTLLIGRHLVMPGNIAGTREIMQWIARELGTDTYVNVMAQYYPAGKVSDKEHAEINRCLTLDEFQEALDVAREAGLHYFDLRSVVRDDALMTVRARQNSDVFLVRGKTRGCWLDKSPACCP